MTISTMPAESLVVAGKKAQPTNHSAKKPKGTFAKALGTTGASGRRGRLAKTATKKTQGGPNVAGHHVAMSAKMPPKRLYVSDSAVVAAVQTSPHHPSTPPKHGVSPKGLAPITGEASKASKSSMRMNQGLDSIAPGTKGSYGFTAPESPSARSSRASIMARKTIRQGQGSPKASGAIMTQTSTKTRVVLTRRIVGASSHAEAPSSNEGTSLSARTPAGEAPKGRESLKNPSVSLPGASGGKVQTPAPTDAPSADTPKTAPSSTRAAVPARVAVQSETSSAPLGWKIQSTAVSETSGVKVSRWSIQPPGSVKVPMTMELTQQGSHLKADLTVHGAALNLISATPALLPHQAVHLPKGVSTLEFSLLTHGGPGEQAGQQSAQPNGSGDGNSSWRGQYGARDALPFTPSYSRDRGREGVDYRA